MFLRDWFSTSPEPQRGRAALRDLREEVAEGRVDLYWLPLGAGGHCVRLNGRLYEALAARLAGRNACDLYHSALVVHLDGDRFVIEMGPVWNTPGPDRGVVCEGPVGLRRLGRLRLFRYEVRCWRGGRIPDVDEAVDSPQRMSEDAAMAQRVLELVRDVPTATWGADEQHTGDMWNSNSLVAWLLVRSGHDLADVAPPAGGRAPGWSAGLEVAMHEGPSEHASSSLSRRPERSTGPGPAAVATRGSTRRKRGCRMNT
jgi:hypothetical protein